MANWVDVPHDPSVFAIDIPPEEVAAIRALVREAIAGRLSVTDLMHTLEEEHGPAADQTNQKESDP